jgi:hypothetical protein
MDGSVVIDLEIVRPIVSITVWNGSNAATAVRSMLSSPP